MQTPENKQDKYVKTQRESHRKRVYHLLPELRRQVPQMFDRMREDDVAEQFGIPVRDVIAEAVRDLRQMVRKSAGSERGRSELIRRSA